VLGYFDWSSGRIVRYETASDSARLQCSHDFGSVLYRIASDVDHAIEVKEHDVMVVA
jgi:hypothetical protein